MKRTLLALSLVAALAAAGAAQDIWGQRQRGQDYWGQRFRRAPPRFPDARSFDGAFNFCRLYFNQVRRHQSGSGWSTDYPDADVNFTIRLSELTKTRVSRQTGGEPNYLVVSATDDALFKCPFLMLEDAGAAGFSDVEITRLREYLLKGGFIWVDDFWGEDAWADWMNELDRILPLGEYPTFDIGMEHPLWRTLFEVKGIPQIPNIGFWRRTGGATSELGPYSEDVHVRGVNDKKGRLMILMTHNTDIADAWEREAEDPGFFYQFSPDGYQIGINVLMYAMTH
jgi:hypothetical protein